MREIGWLKRSLVPHGAKLGMTGSVEQEVREILHHARWHGVRERACRCTVQDDGWWMFHVKQLYKGR